MRDLARVAFHDDGGVTVAAISGEVDVSNASEIARAFEDLSQVSLGMVVDLRELVYLDSSGISLLHDLALRVRQRWTRLVVVSPPSSPPRRVLELTALDSHTLILDELEPAIETLRGQAESRSAD
jgi:anti-anti-sigma factor